MANIRFKTIVILPTNVRCNVKNNRHHKTFSTPFIVNNTVVDRGILYFDTHIDYIIPNVAYIMLHTIGINISGIH